MATYTTLGMGELHPNGVMRLVAGVESLNGLVLILPQQAANEVIARLWSKPLKALPTFGSPVGCTFKLQPSENAWMDGFPRMEVNDQRN